MLGYAWQKGWVPITHDALMRAAMLLASPRVKITPHTVTDLKALRAIVKQVRDRGYAVVEEEFALGGTGIAAPIFDGRGALFAVLDVLAR